MIINPYLVAPSVTYDPDAQAFFTASGITDTTQKNAVNQLVLDLKTYNIWSKMKALYPIVGGTASTHKWNLKDPRDLDSAYRLTFSTGWTHSSTGMNGNGTSAFSDSFIIPITNLSSSNNHLCVYSRTNSIQNVVEFGSWHVGGLTYYDLMYLRSSVGNFVLANGNTSFPNWANSNSTGFYLMSKFNSNTASGYKNNIKVIDSQPVGIGISDRKLYLGCANGGGSATLYSARQIAFASAGDSLTDTESSNLFYSIEKFQTTLGRNVTTNLPTVSDTDAQSFINSANITDVTQANAVNDLVIGLKADGLWTKMKALYPIVGGSASSHAVNLKTPGTYNLTFSTGWTHASTGMTPSSAYANTGLNASTNLTSNSNHLSVYTRTNQVTNAVPIGAYNFANVQLFQLNVSTGTGYYFYTGNTTTEVSSSIADSKGFFMGSQRAINDRKIFRNGSPLASLTSSISTNNPSLSIYLGARNQDNVANANTTQQIAFSSIGDGLSDAEATNFYTRVQNFQTTLGRQV